MRICMICEGSYPYIAGGVSSWIQMLIREFSDLEFSIWSIATTEEEMGVYKYQIPENIKEIRTIYLGSDTFAKKYKKIRLTAEECKTFEELIYGDPEVISWDKTLDFVKKYQKKLVNLLMGEDFYRLCLKEYQRKGNKNVFNYYLWNSRGMYFPLMDILSGPILEADLYHSVSTGYAGILGSAASYISQKPFLLSEHGIYTREREEDIIRSSWVEGEFKELWINFFKRLSIIAYSQADVVTSLFEVNQSLQIELGCPPEKIRIIPNGVDVDGFAALKPKKLLTPGKFHIGTVLRVVPIKDVKTMLMAFAEVKEKLPEAELCILGNYEESPEYYRECLELIIELAIEDVRFFGQVNVKDYLPELEVLLLTSISEGQPLAILEGMAAGVPYIATNVGDCKSLLYGRAGDEFGRAGIIVPVMDSRAVAEAMLWMYQHPKERAAMKEVGQKRVKNYYQKQNFLEIYRNLYQELGGRHGRNRI